MKTQERGYMEKDTYSFIIAKRENSEKILPKGFIQQYKIHYNLL